MHQPVDNDSVSPIVARTRLPEKPHILFCFGRWFQLTPLEGHGQPMLAAHWTIEGAIRDILLRGAQGWPEVDPANYDHLFPNAGEGAHRADH